MNKHHLYTTSFSRNISKKANASAARILPLVLAALPPVRSAVDFGCGEGIWLSELKRNGVAEIKGFDGVWIKPENLQIAADEFSAVDMEKFIYDGKKYDLAISLEVAEHLPETAAASFVKSLTNAADVVLFDAAIPCQGGTNHLNEQFPAYWAKIFAANDFVCLDFIREKIWDIDEIAAYYRQNILLFVKREKLSEIIESGGGGGRKHRKREYIRK